MQKASSVEGKQLLDAHDAEISRVRDDSEALLAPPTGCNNAVTHTTSPFAVLCASRGAPTGPTSLSFSLSSFSAPRLVRTRACLQGRMRDPCRSAALHVGHWRVVDVMVRCHPTAASWPQALRSQWVQSLSELERTIDHLGARNQPVLC